MSLSAEELASFRDKGYLKLPGVFSVSEINSMRAYCKKIYQANPRTTLAGDVFSHPHLAQFALNPKIIDAAKSILGKHLVYFGDSVVQMKARKRRFHRDTKKDFEDPSRSQYPILRFGMYLNDYTNHSGTLKVRQCSHRQRSVFESKLWQLKRTIRGQWRSSAFRFFPHKIVNIPIQSGDVLLWSYRIEHSGNAVQLKRFSSLALHPKVENILPKAWYAEMHEDRPAIFYGLGAPSTALNQYIDLKVNRPDFQDHWKQSSFDQKETLALCEAAGVSVRTYGLTHVRSMMQAS